MKRKTERQKRYQGKMHEKRKFLNVHVSKEIKTGSKLGKRAILVNKGDTVKIMRGSHKGKSAKVQRVSHAKGIVFLEGLTVRNARGTESPIRFQPSNLIITELKDSAYRQKMMKGE